MSETHPNDTLLLDMMESAPRAASGDGPHPMEPYSGVLNALARLFQKCSEISARVAKAEISHALAFYMMGMAHAHWLDAARARELAAPTVNGKPPEDFSGFVEAYEAVLALVRTTAFASNNNDHREEELTRTLKERAANLG